MQQNLVLYRTRKGEEILLSHGRELSANQRRALLVVNGKATLAELGATVFWVSDVVATLEELLALGYIDDQALADGSIVQPADSGPSLKSRLAAIAHELLGEHAQRIIRKVEESEDTPEALEQVLTGCKKLIKLTISEEMADTFLQRGRKAIGK